MQEHIVKALLKPEVYDEKVSQIELIQTHISFVFLTGNFVYKVKKAVNLGFLDFTTLKRRHFYCKRELELNKRLCKGMYIEVVPINRSKATNAIKMKGDGETIEYALKMKRMPQERMLSRLLEEQKVDTQLFDKIAKIIAKFHSKAKSNKEIREFGSTKVIETNWIENFEQTREFIGRTISRAKFDSIQSEIINFIEKNHPLFRRRITDSRIRDCHGDIHSDNIFVTDGVYIFDTIEFNQRFRYSDVASDVAFLAMDLDFKGRTDLSEFFVGKYVEYSKDRDLKRLLPFYKCYRAYVRGKVISFRLKDPNIKRTMMRFARKDAKAYFDLAFAYSKELHAASSKH
ncbi:MAG: phosphotransferase [Candidatus Bathyarchaeota archaeon]|nr:MAG: phosphotransferase [Candidatus Bathyarchaeota archaeon]